MKKGVTPSKKRKKVQRGRRGKRDEGHPEWAHTGEKICQNTKRGRERGKRGNQSKRKRWGVVGKIGGTNRGKRAKGGRKRGGWSNHRGKKEEGQ